jgi:hypothetical protein
MLRLETLTEIAEAAAARAREERAVAQYLRLGRQRPRAAVPAPLLLPPGAADLDAFDGDGERRLLRLLAALSGDERRELLALVHFARSPSQGFARAMRRAQRIPLDAQLGYLKSRRLERDIPLALDRLREASKSSGGVT